MNLCRPFVATVNVNREIYVAEDLGLLRFMNQICWSE